MIVHECNKEYAGICRTCQTDSKICELLEIIHLNQVEWFVVRYTCPNCKNQWTVWDCEYIIAGDPYHDDLYSWLIPTAAE